jgi:hypothetical protein
MGAGPRAGSDYAPISSVHKDLINSGLVDATTGDGMLNYNNATGRRPLSFCTDGLSNTVLITEDAARPQLWRFGRYQDVDAIWSGAGWADDQLDIILQGADPSTGLINGTCPMNCTNDNEVYSFHTTGVPFLFGDGSVRLLSPSIDIRTLARLVTAQGGEVVNPEEF